MVLKSFRLAAASTNIFFFLLGFLQRKVDEIARLSETRRKEQERNFRLVSLERGSSNRGAVVGVALACHLVRVPVWTLYVGWVCFGFFFLLSLRSRRSKGKGKGICARGRSEERLPAPLHVLRAFRASEVPFTFPSEKLPRRLFSARRGFFPATHLFVLLENKHC